MRKSNGKIISTKFKINDIVNISNRGQIYSTYTNAFIFFNIIDKAKRNGNWYFLDDGNYDLNCDWFVCGVALHEDSDNILYHIVNEHNQHLIIGESGLKYIKMDKPMYFLSLEKNKCFIERIPNYNY